MYDDLPRPLLFAHRGASLHAPENTMEAFELAVRLGADVLELDVHLTADQEVAVLHDDTLDRTTDARGPIGRVKSTDLDHIDAGCRFVSPHGERPFVARGVSIPLLREVVTSFPRVGFNIEVKDPDPRAIQRTIDVLLSAGIDVSRRVVLAAGKPDIMERLERAAPPCPLGLSRGQVKEVLQRVYTGRSIEQYQGRALQIPPRSGVLPIATPPVLRAARRSGVPVHIWTINSVRRAEWWLAADVDGVMSDDPGVLVDVFRTAQTRRSGTS